MHCSWIPSSFSSCSVHAGHAFPVGRWSISVQFGKGDRHTDSSVSCHYYCRTLPPLIALVYHFACSTCKRPVSLSLLLHSAWIQVWSRLYGDAGDGMRTRLQKQAAVLLNAKIKVHRDDIHMSILFASLSYSCRPSHDCQIHFENDSAPGNYLAHSLLIRRRCRCQCLCELRWLR